MANAFYGDRWRIDTAGAALLLPADVYTYIKSIEWVGTGMALGNRCLIQDAASHDLWEAFAAATNIDIFESLERHWFNGFKVTVLDAGILHINYK